MEAPTRAPTQPSIQAQGSSPGVHVQTQGSRRTYLIGLAYAVVLTLASFWAASTDMVYAPGVPILLGVLAIAQMGVHLVFFLHISSAPDQTNNVLALAFGVFVVALIVFGSLIIMGNLNHAMMPMDRMMQMQP
jgi:cytochrome o ubiquinol oxidase operon protein cyoD